MASSRYHVPREVWDEYWPGDEYVDWIGYSYWHYEPGENVVLARLGRYSGSRQRGAIRMVDRENG